MGETRDTTSLSRTEVGRYQQAKQDLESLKQRRREGRCPQSPRWLATECHQCQMGEPGHGRQALDERITALTIQVTALAEAIGIAKKR